MQPSRMQLENYFVEELSFQVREDFQPDLENPPKLSPSDLQIEVKLGGQKENDFNKLCHLTIALKENLEKSFPYKFKLVLVGFFQMDSSCTEDMIDVLLKNSAPSMLFTAGRELLLLVTGRARFQSLMLPTMAFLPKKEIKVDSKKTLKAKQKSVTNRITLVRRKPSKKV